MVRVCGQIVQYEVKGQCNVWRRLNKSYYEPFQGFSYCILVSNIVDMQNKIKLNLKNNNKGQEPGKVTLALTDTFTCLNFSISSHRL